MIQLNHVSVSYDSEITALRDLSLTIGSQHCIGIIGENGSGKSTLLSALLGLVDYQGEIIYDGISLAEHKREIRQKVGLVFQNPDHQLFMPTVYQDIVFGLKNMGVSDDECDRRIHLLGKELGIEALLDRRCSSLSGGEKKIVAIATVLAMQPEIVLLDEPSAFLDPKSRRRVIRLLSQLSQQLIIVTHDLDMAMDLCDEMILLNHGQVVQTGTTEEILYQQDLLELYGLELPLQLQGIKGGENDAKKSD